MRTTKWLLTLLIAASVLLATAQNAQPVELRLGFTVVEITLGYALAGCAATGLLLGLLGRWQPRRPQPRMFRT